MSLWHNGQIMFKKSTIREQHLAKQILSGWESNMTILVAVVFDKMYFSKEIDSCHAVIVATTDYFFLLQIGERVLDPTCQQEITCPANNNGNIVIQAFNCPTAGECLIDQFQQVCQCSTQQVLFEGSCLGMTSLHFV